MTAIILISFSSKPRNDLRGFPFVRAAALTLNTIHEYNCNVKVERLHNSYLSCQSCAACTARVNGSKSSLI